MNSLVNILLLFLLMHPVYAQIDDIELYRANAVLIQTAREKGSGFICSIMADSVFVISAYHVVENSKDIIQVKVADGNSFTGKVVFEDIAHDLVMIGMKIPDYKWTPVTIATEVELGEQVFYITMLKPDKPLLPRVARATIDQWNFDKGFQYVSIRDVSGGDSGTALLCSKGIAGIIQTQQVKSLDILTARNLIQAWDKTKWQLKEKP